MVRAFELLERARSDERGAAGVLAAAGMALLFVIAALVLDYARYWIYSAQLQTAADAAALAGASQMWVTQEVDGLGTVYSSEVFIDQFQAEQEARRVLDDNLQNMELARQGLTVISKDVTVNGPQVTVTAVVGARGLIGGVFGSEFTASKIRRTATAEYTP